MAKYYVHTGTDAQGNHEVHEESCTHLPKPENRIYLGTFNNCKDAVQEAKKYYANVDGCWHCSRECHNQ